MNPVETLWIEKYRPRTLAAMALSPEHRVLLESFLQKREIPHLLFTGPPGAGKTTTAKILIDTLQAQALKMNASKDRGIDIIRDRVGTFARMMSMASCKIVFMDEADGLTADAQNSMRALMEDYHDQTRFILAANAGYKIISPLQSRCTIIEFGETPLKERIEILKSILEAEKVLVDLRVLLTYAERYTDLRRMIVAAQTSVAANSGVLRPATEGQFTGAQLIGFLKIGDWDKLVKASQNPQFDHRQALKDMFWAVNGDIAKPAQWRYALAKAVHEGMWTPDPVVHFLGTCAELMV